MPTCVGLPTQPSTQPPTQPPGATNLIDIISLFMGISIICLLVIEIYKLVKGVV